MLIVVKHFEKYRHGKDGAEVAHTRWTTDNPTVRILSYTSTLSEVAPCYTFAMKHHFIYIVVIYIYCCYFNDQCVILLTQAVGNLYQQAMLEDWQMRLQKYCRANLSQSTWFDWLHRGILYIKFCEHTTLPVQIVYLLLCEQQALDY